MKALALAFLVASLWPLHAAKIVAQPFPPARITSLYILKGEGTETTVIQMNGDAVTYTKSVGSKTVETATVHPSDDDWFQFIQKLNGAKVYKWAPRYAYPGQGMSWAVEMAIADQRFSSSGMNEFPKEGAEDQPRAAPQMEPSIPFQLFWQAALGLVGKATLPPAAK